MAIDLFLKKKVTTNEETVEFRYKRPKEKIWNILNDLTIIRLDKKEDKLQLKAKKITENEIDSFVSIHPTSNSNENFSLRIKYDGDAKIWELKLKEPEELLPDRQDPKVNVEMGTDKES